METKNSTPESVVPLQEKRNDLNVALGIDHYRHILSSIPNIILSFVIAFFGTLFFVLSLVALISGMNTIATSDNKVFLWILFIESFVVLLAQLVLGTWSGVFAFKLYKGVKNDLPQNKLISLARKTKLAALINFCMTWFLLSVALTGFVATKIISDTVLSAYGPSFLWVLMLALMSFLTLSSLLIARDNLKANEKSKDYYLNLPVESIGKVEFFLIGIGEGIIKIAKALFGFVMLFVKSFIGIFVGAYKIVIATYKKVVNFFKTFVNTFKNNGLKTRLSYVFMGIGHSFMKRPGKTIMYLGLQILYLVFMFIPNGGLYYLSKFGTLGTSAGYEIDVCQRPGVALEDCAGFIGKKYIPGDNSMLIVLYSVATILLTILITVLYWLSIKGVAKAEQKYEAAKKAHLDEVALHKEAKEALSIDQTLGREEAIVSTKPKFKNPLPTFKDEIKELLNGRFHLTTLSIPTISISLFTILPLVFMILLAFTNYNKDHQPPASLFSWTGLQTFQILFSSVGGESFSSAFFDILQWTFIWAFFATFSNYILGLILAMIINRRGIKMKKLWRTVFVMTIAIPQFVTLLIMNQLLSRYGPINSTLIEWGWIDKAIPFLTNARSAKITVILVNVWVGVPYTMLITSGILMNIPGDLYESARIDGAGPVSQFTKITLPYMLFVTGPYLITQFIGNINNFNVIFFLTGGGPSAASPRVPYGKTDILVTWLFSLTVGSDQKQYAIGSALGIFIFVISVFITLTLYSRTSAATQEGDFA